jgi:hypothetical protein
MKKLGIALAAFAAGLFAQSAASNFDKWWSPEKDATVAAPGNHKILLENDEVRVLQVSVPPHTREPMHVHRYPAVIYLQSSPPNMIEHTEDGKTRDMGMRPDGFARWLPVDQGHFIENTNDKPLLAIRVELKKAR